MSVITTKQLCLYTVGLLVWVIVLSTAIAHSNLVPAEENIEDETRNTRNCKALCDHCACLGFYCGEECICECNDENSDTECIARMQDSARRLKMPFELLIQGPSAHNFVRNALQFEQNGERRSSTNIFTKKRSTVTIYKPESSGGLTFKLKLANNLRSNGINNLNERIEGRPKRSTTTTTSSSAAASNKFEWFSDLNLVRPAPLGGRNKKSDESKITAVDERPKRTKGRSTLDRSWFMDNIPRILTPAPLSKRPGSSKFQQARQDDGDDDAGDRGRDADRDSPSQTPQRPKDSLRALSQDIANAFGGNAMKKPNNDDLDSTFLGKKYRNTLADTASHENPNDDLDSKLEDTLEDLNKQRRAKSMDPPELAWDGRKNPFKDDEVEPELRMPWWRPARFFKRVQYVLNPLT